MRKELLIGCGSRRIKGLFQEDRKEWEGLVTLDINPNHKPDVVWDLTNTDLPFDDNEFDEIHAYDVLEHTGSQGDYKFFFAQFSDFYRILKPDGILFATVPAVDSEWVWGDPSHTRLIHPHQIGFLSQTSYYVVGETPISDFRYIYKADFDVVHRVANYGGSFQFALRAVKPSRIKE